MEMHQMLGYPQSGPSELFWDERLYVSINDDDCCLWESVMCQALCIHYLESFQLPCRVCVPVCALSWENWVPERFSALSAVTEALVAGHDLPQVFLTRKHHSHVTVSYLVLFLRTNLNEKNNTDGNVFLQNSVSSLRTAYLFMLSAGQPAKLAEEGK